MELQELFSTTSAKLEDETQQHNETKKNLEETTTTLVTTQDHLGKTQVRLTERAVILDETRSTEERLLMEANRLLTMLGQSINDIDGLSAKIGLSLTTCLISSCLFFFSLSPLTCWVDRAQGFC